MTMQGIVRIGARTDDVVHSRLPHRRASWCAALVDHRTVVRAPR
ncbi:hypothetical protein ACTU45_03470 [Streptomyces sp. 24-1644]